MKAIFALYPEAAKTKYKSDTEMYAWDKDGNKIELDLDAINNWVDPEAYIGKRLTEYPTLQECVHAILDGNLEELQAKRQAVKAKYPKGDT
jgi:hypothetical protein